MPRWMPGHRALSRLLVLLSVAVSLTACGSAPQEEAAPLAAPAPDAAAPRLAGQPLADTTTAAPGETVIVTVQATGPEPLQSVHVALNDGQGNGTAQVELQQQSDSTWSGPLPLPLTLAAGTYSIEVVLNDGTFATNETLHQSVYRYEWFASDAYYQKYSNRIEVLDTSVLVSPLSSGVSGLLLSRVEVQAP